METVVRSFEYYARICEAGDELPTTEGFRRFIIGRADALVRTREERAKFNLLDDSEGGGMSVPSPSPARITKSKATRRKEHERKARNRTATNTAKTVIDYIFAFIKRLKL